MEKYNWGILGLGTIAHQFAETFHHKNGVLKGAASRNQTKADQFALTYNLANAYGSYDEMLQDPEIDIVYIATPHNHHFQLIMASLQHGKHVLCEKAITITSQELIAAKKLAEEKQLILMEAMTIYNMPLYETLTQRIHSGEWGAVKMINVSFGSVKEADPSNRFFNPELAGGALLDIGTYALSFARTFLTACPSVVASTMLPFKTGVDEQSVTLLNNPSNEMVTVSLSFQAKMPKQGIVALEKAYITVLDYPRADSATITYLDGQTEQVSVGDTSQALNYEIANMMDLITTKQVNQSLEWSTDVMKLMDDMRTNWH